MNILKIKDPQGNWVDIPALKGDKGDKGDPGISPIIDSTLSQTNQAADAKAVGDKIDEITLTIDETLTQSGQVADAKVTGDALNTKADQNGYYENLNVGVADQLASKNYIKDNEPYTFRPTANGAKVGTREFDTIVGGSIVWNQLVDDINSSVTVTSGHKYIAKIDGAYSVAVSDGTAVAVTGGTDEVFDVTQMFGSKIADHIYSLEQATADAGVAWFRKYFPKDYYEYNSGELMHVSDLQSHNTVGFNLLPFAPVYAQLNAILDKKKAVRVFPNQKYIFNFDSIGDATKWRIHLKFWDINGNTVGGSGNIPFSTDALSPFWASSTSSWVEGADNVKKLRYYVFNRPGYVQFYFGNGTTTSDMEIKNAVFNLSWSGTRNGEYEPYVKHSYPLDSSLTLRGVPKLTVDGDLSYDGDIYKPNGTVERRYGIVDLGMLNWSYSGTTFRVSVSPSNYKGSGSNNIPSDILCAKYTNKAYSETTGDKEIRLAGDGDLLAIKDSAYTDAAVFKTAMSGVLLVYELATSTTEEAESYASPQIIDPYGTEEYVTTSIVPVGHQTQYPEDLRAKIESLPWDFANLIAPVEVTYKATQNYTAGSLFIIDNILYKATTNIANGGTITPNTNCTPTTLAEIIAAL